VRLNNLIAYLLIALTIFSQTHIVYSASLMDFLAKGDVFIYTVDYAYENTTHRDYYEINVINKYYSIDLYVDLNIKYTYVYSIETVTKTVVQTTTIVTRRMVTSFETLSNTVASRLVVTNATYLTRTTGEMTTIETRPANSIEKQFIGISINDLSNYIPSCEETDILDMVKRGSTKLTVPIPVVHWNPPSSSGDVISYKGLDLKLGSQQDYMLLIGGKNLTIKAFKLFGNDAEYNYIAYVDRDSGILLDLHISSRTNNTLLYRIYLSYTNKYKEGSIGETNINTGFIPSLVILILGVSLATIIYLVFRKLSKLLTH